MASAGNDTQNNTVIAVVTIVGIVLTYVSIILAQTLFYSFEERQWQSQLDKPRKDVVEYRDAQADLLKSGVEGKTAMAIDKAITTLTEELTAPTAAPVTGASEENQ